MINFIFVFLLFVTYVVCYAYILCFLLLVLLINANLCLYNVYKLDSFKTVYFEDLHCFVYIFETVI